MASNDELDLLDAYWRAANYLTVGQIYLRATRCCARPCPRSTSSPGCSAIGEHRPGLSFVYVHLNRLIRDRDANVIYVAGPGHGGPALVANVYLEGTYTEIYPDVTANEDGMLRLFRQFSTPGGIPSHVSVPTPGSIHEGGELGYALVHAFGAAFDNPDLVVACVIGDGEAETGPLEGSWKGVQLPESGTRRRGAADPASQRLQDLRADGARSRKRRGRCSLLAGHGYDPACRAGDDPEQVHRDFAARSDSVLRLALPRDPGGRPRSGGSRRRPRWPAIVLRTRQRVDRARCRRRRPVEGTFRATRSRSAACGVTPTTSGSSRTGCAPTDQRSCSTRTGRSSGARTLAPEGDRRMGANPHANGGRLLMPLDLPDYSSYAST